MWNERRCYNWCHRNLKDYESTMNNYVPTNWITQRNGYIHRNMPPIKTSFNRWIVKKEIESIIKNFPKKIPKLDCFTGELYQRFKEKLMAILLRLFQNWLNQLIDWLINWLNQLMTNIHDATKHWMGQQKIKEEIKKIHGDKWI